MDFIANYWVILVVVFILILLVLLSYLIDKEIRKMKDNDNKDDTGAGSTVDSDLKEYYSYNEDNDGDNANIENNHREMQNDIIEESKELVDDTSSPLEYDELDIEDIDADFNKLIHKKKLIDDFIKDSVEALKVEKLEVKEENSDDKIELPDIKIKKDTNEDVWKK